MLFFFLCYHNTDVLLDGNNILQDEIDILIPKCGWHESENISHCVPVVSFIFVCNLHFLRKKNISSRI